MDFKEFEKWIYINIGINLSAYKSQQLHRRIESLMTREGISNLEEYTKVLRNDSVRRQKFLDHITINVTEFYRNPELFRDLEEIIKKEYSSQGKPLKVWSAACSIGCEPYTMAMIFKNNNVNSRSQIIATDIDNTILRKAKDGTYSENEIKNVPSIEMNKYFKKEDNKYIIDNSIKSMVQFKKHDLILDKYEEGFDLIICRNVVIYFNNDVKEQIYERFLESLKPGGYLFVGATESIYNYKKYGLEKAKTFIYRKGEI